MTIMTETWTSGPYETDDAGFQACFEELEAALTVKSCWVRVPTTGDLASFSALGVTPGAVQSFGWRIYKFNDAIAQGNGPTIWAKITFATRFNGNEYNTERANKTTPWLTMELNPAFSATGVAMYPAVSIVEGIANLNSTIGNIPAGSNIPACPSFIYTDTARGIFHFGFLWGAKQFEMIRNDQYKVAHLCEMHFERSYNGLTMQPTAERMSFMLASRTTGSMRLADTGAPVRHRVLTFADNSLSANDVSLHTYHGLKIPTPSGAASSFQPIFMPNTQTVLSKWTSALTYRVDSRSPYLEQEVMIGGQKMKVMLMPYIQIWGYSITVASDTSNAAVPIAERVALAVITGAA